MISSSTCCNPIQALEQLGVINCLTEDEILGTPEFEPFLAEFEDKYPGILQETISTEPISALPMIPIFPETKLEEIEAFMRKNYVRRAPRRYNNPKSSEFSPMNSEPPKLVSNPGKSTQGTQPPPQSNPKLTSKP